MIVVIAVIMIRTMILRMMMMMMITIRMMVMIIMIRRMTTMPTPTWKAPRASSRSARHCEAENEVKLVLKS